MDYEIAWTEPAVADLESIVLWRGAVKTRQQQSVRRFSVTSKRWLDFPSSAQSTSRLGPAEYAKSFASLTGSSIESMNRSGAWRS